jgi:hypothetical protein
MDQYVCLLSTHHNCLPVLPCPHPVTLQTLSNLADAQVSLGEAALLLGQPAAGEAAFEGAVQAYQASCALSDSANGEQLV